MGIRFWCGGVGGRGVGKYMGESCLGFLEGLAGPDFDPFFGKFFWTVHCQLASG